MSFAPNPEHPPIPPTTTKQQDLTLEGQRKVNLIWEYTQAFIAICVVVSTMIAGVACAMNGKGEQQVPTILSVAFGTVVGFYFSRTNHTAIGGVGRKPAQQEYEGR